MVADGWRWRFYHDGQWWWSTTKVKHYDKHWQMIVIMIANRYYMVGQGLTLVERSAGFCNLGSWLMIVLTIETTSWTRNSWKWGWRSLIISEEGGVMAWFQQLKSHIWSNQQSLRLSGMKQQVVSMGTQSGFHGLWVKIEAFLYKRKNNFLVSACFPNGCFYTPWLMAYHEPMVKPLWFITPMVEPPYLWPWTTQTLGLQLPICPAKWQVDTALDIQVAAVPTISAKVSAFTEQAKVLMSSRGSGHVRTWAPWRSWLEPWPMVDWSSPWWQISEICLVIIG